MYNFRDLILLMGTNPLPNYVVAKYFLTANPALKRIWILHSPEDQRQLYASTRELAEELRRIIQEDAGQLEVKVVALSNISSASRIKHDVENKVIEGLPKREISCHLNYTGGTKAMAVHTYRALESNPDYSCSFSYLDARDFRLKVDRGDHITGDLRNEIQVSLDTLMRMHMAEGSIGSEPPDWPEVLEKFTELIEQSRLGEYLDWVESFMIVHHYRDGQFIYQDDEFLRHNGLVNDENQIIREKTCEFQTNFSKITPPSVLELLRLIPPEHSPLEGGKWWIPQPRQSRQARNEIKYRLQRSINNYLHGKWLESYVQKVVADHTQGFPEESKASNWEIKRQNSEKPFELDVILVHGYQVLGISVTADSSEKLCKLKGMEVIHRVNQIGGDEGKAILVTCLSEGKKYKLQNDLYITSGSPEGKIMVLGIEDLPRARLWAEIETYIRR